MKRILLVVLFLLLGLSQSFAEITKTFSHNLTISGTPINGTVIATSTTVTSDSVYESGASSFGSAVLVTNVKGANAGVKITYQTSYDNTNWYSPTTTNGSGTLTNVATLQTLASTDSWIIFPNAIYPYIRFNFAQGAGGTATITAETIYQDWQ